MRAPGLCAGCQGCAASRAVTLTAHLSLSVVTGNRDPRGHRHDRRTGSPR
jgi:hypothetical protein